MSGSPEYEEALAHARALPPGGRALLLSLLSRVMADQAERRRFVRWLRARGRDDWTEATILRHGATALTALKSLPD